MRTSARFISVDDYYNYTGKYLQKILQPNENNSNTADLFLMQIEDRVLAKIDEMSFRVTDFNELTAYQKENLQKAIIEECEYIMRNSDIFTDSGYDLERGEIISKEKLKNLELCNIAETYLRNCGLLNQKIGNRKRWTTFF